ncbi:MBL fold metallo-hydrolase [Halanaerobium salsuginis]|uniref:Phosphoribosyl 1,2-cyclic phosphodiesterase n=1 Tax=Halanaerobium salsuginis TaxID=29563 RepID=A0A1I4J8K0_9FIRM|nr:MBL fold metallo-hydrolase [Halanaerobium salsuginis]SFL62547.1 Phosphoribosyl 1,2-cyclic phosphodiesterase [Halanaerobium salsuginis]
MQVEISVLASGSKGNCTYIRAGEHAVLIDAGLSGKKIEQRLSQLDRDPAELDALLITHEHKDHIKSIGVLSRRYDLPIYANQGTWQAAESEIGRVKKENCRIFEQDFMIGDLAFEAYPVSHDAEAPVGYICRAADRKIVLATDTGVMSAEIISRLRGADFFVLESNHDLEMLMTGRYPYFLKNRIKGTEGHLSNDDTAAILPQLVRDNFPTVVLAHLSEENNNPKVAYITVNNALKEAGLKVGRDLQLGCASQKKSTPLFKLIKEQQQREAF